MSTKRDQARASIAKKVRGLREERRWTQTELAQRLGLSQSRLSEIEHGLGSFTAEQFLTILKLFNVPVTHFASERRPGSEVQNALARLGAVHLQESPDVLPSERLEEIEDVFREVLIAADSPRHITALAPVLATNIDRVNLKKLQGHFIEAGLEERFGWLVANTLEAIRQEERQRLPRQWAASYRRADVILGGFLSLDLEGRFRKRATRSPDVLDPDIRSAETLEEVRSASSTISRHWGIATAIQPDDFVKALRASRVTR